MAITYAELLTRIAVRLNRDDLDSIIRLIAEERIRYYQREVAWSALFTDTSIVTVQGTKWYDFPSGWDEIHGVRLLQGTSIWLTLTKVDYDTIEELDNIEPGIQSLPAYWSSYGSPNNPNNTMALRLYPTPGTTYQLELSMFRPPSAPADNASNFWTDDGLNLLLAATGASVCSTHINDPVRKAEFQEMEITEKRSLDSRSIRSGGGIRVKPYF